MSDSDYHAIVVGQGLAGTALAWALRWRGQRVLVIDRDQAGTSSRIAAGLITPVTGQRLVKSWRWEQFRTSAETFYHRAETECHARFFIPQAIVRLLESDAEQEFLVRRMTSSDANLLTPPRPPVNRDWFNDSRGGVEMLQGARLNVAAFLEASRRLWQQQGQFVTADLDLRQDIVLTHGGVRLPELGVSARRLIFCQGFDAALNPWFPHIRFRPAKGEILTVRIDGLAEARTVSCGVWLTPIGDSLFRVGATYEWSELDSHPTAKGREEICARLRAFLRLPFELIGHDAAVRPILRHQYPVVGLHPQHWQLGLFNGLGSKGSLQAPWLADHFAAFLAENRPLDPAVTPYHYDKAAGQSARGKQP